MHDTDTETFWQRVERETIEATDLIWEMRTDPMWRVTTYDGRTAMAVYLGGDATHVRPLYGVVADRGCVEVWSVGLVSVRVESFLRADGETIAESLAAAMDYARKAST